MNKWISPVSLCMLLCVLFTNAQDALQTPQLSILTDFLLETEKSILTKTTASLNHTTLTSLLQVSDLLDVLHSSGQFTVFAPSDRAFKKMSKSTLKKLLDPENKKEVNRFLSGHIIAGKLSASHILKAMCSGSGSTSFTTIQGEELIATIDGIDIILTDGFGNQAKILKADTNQRNGVIHEIDAVFLPLGSRLP